MKKEAKKNSDENIIYVGNKPIMSYVLAIITQFQSKTEEVQVKARGRVISKAVDVVEFVKNKFIKDLKIKNISIGTEQVSGERGEVNVSVINIVLTK